MTQRTAVVSLALLLVLTGCSSEIARADGRETEYLAMLESSRLDRSERELLEAGHEACAMVAGGRNLAQVRVFDDETKEEEGFYPDSFRVTIAAVSALCP